LKQRGLNPPPSVNPGCKLEKEGLKSAKRANDYSYTVVIFSVLSFSHIITGASVSFKVISKVGNKNKTSDAAAPITICPSVDDHKLVCSNA
jgi:hypothetical protein